LKSSPSRLGLVQMRVQPGNSRDNIRRALQFIAQAAEHGAQIALLPEALPLGWTDPSALKEAEPIPQGPWCSALREAACAHRIHLCSGVVERADNLVYNAALLISPTGQILLHHRKLNELEIGQSLYALGDRLQVASTPHGTIGLMICADAFVPGQVISRTLAYMGADIILSPCSWAVPAGHDNRAEPYGQLWLDNYGPVARDFRLWIAGVSNVGPILAGPWRGRKCIGCSLVIDPNGKPALMGPYGEDAETILYVDIAPTPRPAQGDGWARLWAAANP